MIAQNSANATEMVAHSTYAFPMQDSEEEVLVLLHKLLETLQTLL